ncbi:hypothetical protein ACJZ2D_016773 [Fusarium nematophilum]
MARRGRSEQNRNPQAGIRNRRRGLSKKANTFYRFYGGQVALVFRRPDGSISGYESHIGLLRELANTSIPVSKFLGPGDFEEGRDTPDTTSQLDDIGASISSFSDTQSLSGSSSSDGSNTSGESSTMTNSTTLALPIGRSVSPDTEADASPKRSPQTSQKRAQPRLLAKPPGILPPRPISTRLRLALMAFLDSCLA